MYEEGREDGVAEPLRLGRGVAGQSSCGVRGGGFCNALGIMFCGIGDAGENDPGGCCGMPGCCGLTDGIEPNGGRSRVGEVGALNRGLLPLFAGLNGTFMLVFNGRPFADPAFNFMYVSTFFRNSFPGRSMELAKYSWS